MAKPKPNYELAAFFQVFVQAAMAGEIKHAFVVTDDIDGEFDVAYETDDIQSLISEVNNLALRTRIDEGRTQLVMDQPMFKPRVGQE